MVKEGKEVMGIYDVTISATISVPEEEDNDENIEEFINYCLYYCLHHTVMLDYVLKDYVKVPKKGKK
jgi:hypothetical protein